MCAHPTTVTHSHDLSLPHTRTFFKDIFFRPLAESARKLGRRNSHKLNAHQRMYARLRRTRMQALGTIHGAGSCLVSDAHWLPYKAAEKNAFCTKRAIGRCHHIGRRAKVSFLPPISEDTLRVFEGLPVDLCPRLSPTPLGGHTSCLHNSPLL